MTEIGAKSEAQKLQRGTLKNKLEVALAACKTSKELIERFPEFAKYLPEDVKSVMLPTTTQLMDTLKNSGWPGKPETKTAKTRKTP